MFASINGITRGPTIFGIAAFTIISALSSLQLRAQPVSTLAYPAQSDNAKTEPPVLELKPASEPIPAMKYRLWPDRMAMQPGNAMVRFQRAVLLLSQESRENPQVSTEFWEKWNGWIELPVSELPTEDVRKALEKYRLVLREMHNGRLLVESSYNLPVDQIKGLETVEILLPEFQEMRSLARLLQLEIRLAIAEERYDDAITSLQTGFRLGEATGQAIDYLIARLVGLAINGIMLGEVENLMLAEGSPNLYWAIACLPPSISEIQESIQFEASIMSRVFTSLENLPESNLSPQVWEERATQVLMDLQKVQSYGVTDDESLKAKSKLLAAFAVISLAGSSKATLIDSGMSADAVDAMSPAEAVVRATSYTMRVIQDNFVKYTYLPAVVEGDYLVKAENEISVSRGTNQSIGNLATVMAGLLLPAIRAAGDAGKRSEQAIARLTTIEAIRHHVALYGEVPAKLSELKSLPAWPDPISGRNSFGYEKTGPKSAKLSRAPRWNGDEETTFIVNFQ